MRSMRRYCDRLVAVPGVEDGVDGEHQLLARVLREVVADMLLVGGLVPLHEFLEVVRREVGVELDLFLVLHPVNFVLEVFVFNAHRGRAEHVDKSPIAVVGEARVAGLLGKTFDARIREAQVEDGVHHPGHREALRPIAPRRGGGRSCRRTSCRRSISTFFNASSICGIAASGIFFPSRSRPRKPRS